MVGTAPHQGNVAIECPFAPRGSPSRLECRAANYEYLRNDASFIDVKSNTILRIHATEDPTVAVAEWSASGRVLKNANPYEMRYATFATFRDGLMVGYREYRNPAAFMAATGNSQF